MLRIDARWIVSCLMGALLLLAGAGPAPGEDGGGPAARPTALHQQVLYSLLVVEVASESLDRLMVEDLRLTPDEEGEGLQFLGGPDLVALSEPRLEVELAALREEGRWHLLQAPQLVVAPNRTGRLYVAQEELLWDAPGTDLLRRTTALELLITPGSGFAGERGVLTRIQVNVGDGVTGLATTVRIGPDEPVLLGVVRRTDGGETGTRVGGWRGERYRHFALYLTARPAGILTLSDPGVGSLSGLEGLFARDVVRDDRGHIQIALRVSGGERLAVSGWVQSETATLRYRLNEAHTGSSVVGLTHRFYSLLQLGAELVICRERGPVVGLALFDSVDLGPLVLSAGVTPYAYRLHSGREDVRWFIRGETRWEERLQGALEYRAEGERGWLEAGLGWMVHPSWQVRVGHTLERDGGGVTWVGLRLAM